MYIVPGYINSDDARQVKTVTKRAKTFIDNLDGNLPNDVFVNRLWGLIVYDHSGYVVVIDYSKRGQFHKDLTEYLKSESFLWRASRASSVRHMITQLPPRLSRDINFLTYILSEKN